LTLACALKCVCALETAYASEQHGMASLCSRSSGDARAGDRLGSCPCRGPAFACQPTPRYARRGTRACALRASCQPRSRLRARGAGWIQRAARLPLDGRGVDSSGVVPTVWSPLLADTQTLYPPTLGCCADAPGESMASRVGLGELPSAAASFAVWRERITLSALSRVREREREFKRDRPKGGTLRKCVTWHWQARASDSALNFALFESAESPGSLI